MSAEFFAFLLVPFGRYRHRCDPPELLTRLSFLPRAFDSGPVSLACRSNFFILFFISQRLSVIEPFIHPFRHTIVQPISPMNCEQGIQENEEKMKSPYCVPSHFPPTGNPNLFTPWSRFRHGCDPPDSLVSSECLPPPSTPHQFFVEPHSTIYSIPQVFTEGIMTFQKFFPDELDIRKPSKESFHDIS